MTPWSWRGASKPSVSDWIDLVEVIVVTALFMWWNPLKLDSHNDLYLPVSVVLAAVPGLVLVAIGKVVVSIFRRTK